MPTKKEVQQWAREEWARLDLAKTLEAQAACTHTWSGTLQPGTKGIARCDACGKDLAMDDSLRMDDDPRSPNYVGEG